MYLQDLEEVNLMGTRCVADSVVFGFRNVPTAERYRLGRGDVVGSFGRAGTLF